MGRQGQERASALDLKMFGDEKTVYLTLVKSVNDEAREFDNVRFQLRH
jgi:hypothetical protein